MASNGIDLERIVRDSFQGDTCFSDIKEIDDFRKKANCGNGSSKGKAAYGFEWHIHTCLAHFLISHKAALNINSLCINRQSQNNKKCDISFNINNTKYFVEIKTFESQQFARAQDDIKKLLKIMNGAEEGYVIAIGYPHDESRKALNEVKDAQLLKAFRLDAKFRVYIFEVCSGGTVAKNDLKCK